MKSLIRFTSLALLAVAALPSSSQAQFFEVKSEFTLADTLRGTITPERDWWDVTYYHLDVKVDIEAQTIYGSNLVQYRILESTGKEMQIDLQEPMNISRITQDGAELEYRRIGNAFFVTLEADQPVGSVKELTVEYGGKPVVAARPPWDGGITWVQDRNGNPFVASANQGIGASVWWPNKDHPADEPDSILISVTVPDNLMDVSNGRLRGVDEHNDGTKTWHWFVGNPINNYGVNINIGDYIHIPELYEGEDGELTLDYYVLSYNRERAIAQFADAPRTIEAFEHWFGPYPFYKDGFKLVEAPYLGMEHQSSVTYGNGYQNGYLGRDLSQSGWGLRFDFIIVHESGHEWFANSITSNDVADLWVHESFTNYSENLFLDYHFGREASEEYVIGTRLNISNDRPIEGIRNVHYEGSSDMYYKGGNLLHNIRTIINDDEVWRSILRGLNKEYYHQTVTGEQIESYISEKSGMDLSKVFDQYLRDVRIPVLEYAFKGNQVRYRWGNVIADFDMPVDVVINGKSMRLTPTTQWQEMATTGVDKSLDVDVNFYVGKMNVLGSN